MKYYTVRQFAEALGVSHQAVYDRINGKWYKGKKKERIRVVKIGSYSFIPASELKHWQSDGSGKKGCLKPL